MDEIRDEARNMRMRHEFSDRPPMQPDAVSAGGPPGGGAAFAGVMVTIDHTTGLGWVRKATGTVGALVAAGDQLRCWVGKKTHVRENKEVVVFDMGSGVDPQYAVFRPLQGIIYAKPANIDPNQTTPAQDSATGGKVQ